jgi:copper(I)-binding protein
VIGSGWGRTVPRRLALVAVAALIPVLAGCEAGNNAPTLDFHYPTDASGTAVGNLAIRNVFVLGAPLGRDIAKGQSASLFLALVNNGTPDTLTSISAPGTATSVTLPASVPVDIGHPVFFTGPRPQVVLTHLTRPLVSGTTIKLVLTFQKAGPITLLVPVFARATHYVTYAPPQPTPSAALTVAAAKRRRGHAGASASTSASTSTSPSPSVTATPSPSPSTTG